MVITKQYYHLAMNNRENHSGHSHPRMVRMVVGPQPLRKIVRDKPDKPDLGLSMPWLWTVNCQRFTQTIKHRRYVLCCYHLMN